MLRVFSDERCLAHSMPFGFPEVPERLEAVVQACRDRDWEVPSQASSRDTAGSIAAVHDPVYVERFKRASERGDGLLCSSDNPLSEHTWEASHAAVACALDASDWIAGGTARTAFVATRPPGHHAERDAAMGFCYFNNIAIAAQHLRDHHGMERVAIFDPDVHHGNGTQHIFEERADVLYASTHQFPFYPGTGSAAETGIGRGEGATLNVPLPAGTGDAGYAQALEERILPALAAFRPQALLISAGFDAWKDDPLGGMEVSRHEIWRWGRVLGELAAEVCEGRVLALLEGGYDLQALGSLATGFVAELSGSTQTD